MVTLIFVQDHIFHDLDLNLLCEKININAVILIFALLWPSVRVSHNLLENQPQRICLKKSGYS